MIHSFHCRGSQKTREPQVVYTSHLLTLCRYYICSSVMNARNRMKFLPYGHVLIEL
jgi:hypothetical protein